MKDYTKNSEENGEAGPQGVLFGFTDEEIEDSEVLEDPTQDDPELEDEELAAIHAQIAEAHQLDPTLNKAEAKSTEKPESESSQDDEETAADEVVREAEATEETDERSETEKQRDQRREERRRQRRERMGAATTTGTGPSRPGSVTAPASPFAASTPFGATPGRPGALDPRVAAQEAKPGPPSWLGKRWREIPQEDQREAWVGLRRWVDWFIPEYQLNKDIIPACWYRHRPLIAELYAAMNMEHKAWDEGAPSMSPMSMWHQSLPALIDRLRTITGDLGSCKQGRHHETEDEGRDYDEDDWRKVVYGRRETKTVTRPGYGEEGFLVRATIIGPGETAMATSEKPVGISPIHSTDQHQVLLQVDGTSGATDSIITLNAEAVPEASEVIWEKTDEWVINEDGTIAADWEIYTDPEDDDGNTAAADDEESDDAEEADSRQKEDSTDQPGKASEKPEEDAE